MLYVTNSQDTFPAFRTLVHDRGPDGARFMPYRLTPLTQRQLDGLTARGYSHAMAEILNLLLGSRLDETDVDFLIGKNPVRLVSMSHRIVIGELWRNEEQSFDYPVRMLSHGIVGDNAPEKPTEWAKMAARIGALFGIFALLRKNCAWTPGQFLDIAVDADNFTAPMAAAYAMELGLPAANLVCGCREDSIPWDLFRQGELRISSRRPQDPGWLEQLIRRRLGREEADKFCRVCSCGGVYCLDPVKMEILRSGISAAVISSQRAEAMVPNIYHTNSYLMGQECAYAYGGLQDFRVRNGEPRTAVILSETAPGADTDFLARGMGIPAEELAKLLQTF